MQHEELLPYGRVRRPPMDRAHPGRPRRLPRLRRDRLHRLGAPADVPDLRARRLLRLQPAPPRQCPPRRHRAPGDALVRAGRELAVVLRGPAHRLNQGDETGARSLSGASAPESPGLVPLNRVVRPRAATAVSGWSANSPSTPASRNATHSATPSPRSASPQPRRRSAGRKTFSSRKVKACTASPAACASPTSGPGSPSVSAAVRGITRFLWTPTASAYSAIAARPSA